MNWIAETKNFKEGKKEESETNVHPPSRLSLILPTRADMTAIVAISGRPAIFSSSLSSTLCAFFFFFGKKGEKCLRISMGPRTLVRKVNKAFSASICAGDFSGNRMPGTMKASWRCCCFSEEEDEEVLAPNCCLHDDAACSIVFSSI